MASPESSRKRILETAREHFLERSYHGATLREIARDASVTTGSLYHHFSGKDELFVEVCVEGMRILLRRLQTAAQLTEGRPTVERFLALFDAYVAFYIEERGYFELMERLQRGRDSFSIGQELADRVDASGDHIVDEMVNLLGETEPGLDPDELRKRVLFAVALSEGLVACDRRNLLARFDTQLGAFRGIVASMAEHLVAGADARGGGGQGQ